MPNMLLNDHQAQTHWALIETPFFAPKPGCLEYDPTLVAHLSASPQGCRWLLLVNKNVETTWKSPGDVNKTPYNQGDLLGETKFSNCSETFWRCTSIWTSATWSVTNRFFFEVFGRFRTVGPADPRGRNHQIKKSQKPIHGAFSRHQKTINICKINRIPRAKLFKWSFESENDQPWGGPHPTCRPRHPELPHMKIF